MRAKVALITRPLGIRGGALGTLGALASVVALVGAASRLAWPHELVTIGAGFVATLALGALWLMLPRLPQARQEGIDLELDETWLRVGAKRVRRAAIVRALVMPSGAGAVVELHAGQKLMPVLTLDLATREEADALVRELGHSAEDKVAPFLALSPFATDRRWVPLLGAWIVVALAAGAGLSARLGSPVPMFVFLASILAACLTSSPSQIHVGTDGLAWFWLGRRRFVPWSRVRSAKRVDLPGQRSIDALEIDIDGEPPIRFAMTRDAVGTDTPDRVLERIAQARRASLDTQRGPAAAALGLADAGDPQDHIARVKKLVAKNDEYRSTALRKDQIDALLADPEAPPTTRVLAAVAAVSASRAEGKERVRIAADATADRDLRAAFEAAAEEDDPLLATRLAALRAR